MRRPWQRILWGLVVLVVTLMAVAPPAMAAQTSAGGGGGDRGGGSGGSGGGSSRSTQCPPPPGEPDPPGCSYIKYTYTRDAYDSEIPSKAQYIGTGRWTWWSDVSYPYWIDWDPGYPKYNQWIYDPTSDKPLKYEFAGIRSEGPYYIEDEYRPLVRKYYDKWQLEHGRVYAKSIWWSEIHGWPRMIVYVWNDGTEDQSPAGTYNPNRTSVTFNNNKPIRGIHYCPATCAEDFPNPYSRSPRRPLVKNPPIYDRQPDGREKPPLGPYPEDWLGDEMECDNCQYKDVWDPNGIWRFGGRPSRKLFAVARGDSVVLGIDTLAEGDAKVPPALHKVTEVIIRVEGINGAQSKAFLSSGTPQKGQWRAAILVPYGTKIGRYRVVFEIRGTNYWGHPRQKVVYGTLQVTGGEPPECKPWEKDCGRKVGFCGLDEEAMRRLGDKWMYECVDPKLVK